MDATSTQAKNHKSETESTFPNGDTIVFTPKSDELSEVEKKFKEAFDEANNEFIKYVYVSVLTCISL